MTTSIETAVDRLIDARSVLRPFPPLTESDGELTLEQAYAIQHALRVELILRGQTPIGWKLAATGPTGQALFGITEPIYGFLFADAYQNGAVVSASAFVNLHVEAEIAFKLGADLVGPGVTAGTALQAVEGVFAALELPDASFSGKPRVTDVIANSALAKSIMLGEEFSPPAGIDLAAEAVVLEHNGEVVSQNAGGELMGNPLNALAWLANQLAADGHMLKRGDVVMSGAISKLLRPNIGDTIAAKFTRLGTVHMKVVA